MMFDKYKSYGKLQGKHVVYNHYIHKSLLPEMPIELHKEINMLDKKLYFHNSDAIYNIIKIDTRKDTISFILSKEFDKMDEPCLDTVYVMKSFGKMKVIDYTHRNKDNIPVYHHKWMMVGGDYDGFDVKESYKRSEWWYNHPVVLDRKKKDRFFKARVGMYGYWNELLKEMNKYDENKC